MAATAEATGVNRFALGFVVSDGSCAAEWDGTDTLDNTSLDSRLSALRKAGGDVSVSFGGQDGSELALACGSTTELAAAYATVIDRYNLTEADFDIEGTALTDTAANTRRAKAIAQIQKEATAEGRTPDISFTLAAMPDGLTRDAVAFLKNAEANGVDISSVNIMAMDYGDSYTGDMGDYAIQAATGAHTQLKSILGLSDAAAWRTLAVTPMIGVNDITTENFTVSDAGQLAAFAARKGIGRLSMWSAGRDTSSRGFTNAMAGS
jgi:chitinase